MSSFNVARAIVWTLAAVLIIEAKRLWERQTGIDIPVTREDATDA